MCGIAGIVKVHGGGDSASLVNLLTRMSEKIQHRGPDDQGIWIANDASVGLAHRRLSIVDLSPAGHQPMHSQDQRYVLTFNGEIYNYLELRQELQEQGVQFSSRSDSEVLIESYRAWGEDCLTRFDGMFAFAIYDQETRSLFAARDPFGEKPFYYSRYNGDFSFASELSALACLPDFKASTDLATVTKFLCLQYVGGSDSLYHGTHKLKPGHFLTLDHRGILREQRYFEFQPEPSEVFDEEDLLDELEAILLKSIQRRFRADVPVGAFLSGGLDSSLVVALATKKLGLDIQTFTIGFEGWSDSEHLTARETAAYLGTRHTEKILAPNCYALFDELVSKVDEPNGDTSLLPTYLLSQMAREHVKVVLSGDGADELFGGYGRYFSTLAEAAGNNSKQAGEYQVGHAYYSHKILTFTEVDLISLLVKLPQEASTALNRLREALNDSKLHLINRLRKTDIENYLPGAVLAKVDRMSMQNALEVRSPFLSVELAHFAEKLPPHLLADGQGGKYLLKKLAARYLPASLIDKPKRGFGLPQSLWGEQVLLEKAEQRLLKQSGFRYWWLKQEGIKPWMEHGKQHQASEIYKLWSIYHLDLFIELNHVSPADRTNPVHLWMLGEKLLERQSPTLVLSVFPVEFHNANEMQNVHCISIWEQRDNGWHYEQSRDWMNQLSSAFRLAEKNAGQVFQRLVMVGVDSTEIYRNNEFLEKNNLQQVLIFEDSMWQSHRLKKRKGWRQELDKVYPAVFSIPEQRFTSLQCKTMWQDLLFFLHCTFSPFGNNPHDDPFLKQEPRRLLDSKSPLRAYALAREVLYALKHVIKEHRHFKCLERQIRGGFRRKAAQEDKFIFVLPSLYSGGAERQACNLMVALAQQGKKVHLLSLSPLVGSSAHYLPLLERSGVGIIDMSEHYQGAPFDEIKATLPEESLRVLAYDHPLMQRQIWPVFYRIFSEIPANVVCFLDTPNIIGGVSACLAGVPGVVTSFRNINPTSFDFYERWYDPYYAALVQAPNLVMTGNSLGGNQSYANWLKLPETKIRLLRNGVDFTHYQTVSAEAIAKARERLDLEPNSLVIGGVFRLSEEKRPTLFIEIIRQLLKLNPNVKAFIAGEGPLKTQLERQIEVNQLQHRIQLLGPVKEVSPFISLSTLMLQTSRTEGTANSLLEAQYLKVPVVATPGGGVEESFDKGKSGWLLNDDDPEEMAQQLASILQSPEELQQRGQYGHEFVLRHFTLDQSVNSLLEFCHLARNEFK
jgi:asparagine synthase (glutamine-hydrolysing)